MITDVLIRTACADDLPAIMGLWREFMDFHAGCNPLFARSADGDEWFKEQLISHLLSDKSCILVAEHAGIVVGYCFTVIAQYPPVFEITEYGAIYDLAVTESCRRRGIGEKLFREAQAWLATRGIHRIEARYVVANPISTAFWKKMGFEPLLMMTSKNI
ncbi:MAG: GNAT family N-acetyltransferase [Candidatus Sumerlaeia bacterium]